MKSWKPTPEDNPRPVVVILRGLLSVEADSKSIHRARYNELWESVRDEFASETTFQVYLNWLVKQRIVRREKRTRKEVWYSVIPGDSAVLTQLDESIEAIRKRQRMIEIHFTDLVQSFVQQSAFDLMIAITENLSDPPVDLVSRKLGPVNSAHLLAENIALTFLQLVRQALYSKDPARLYGEALEGDKVVDRMLQAIEGQGSAINSSQGQQLNQEPVVSKAPEASGPRSAALLARSARRARLSEHTQQ